MIMPYLALAYLRNFNMAANPYFKFKQFTVWHDRCAMKVGTDSVLLGAWVSNVTGSKVLDIGAGTGLLSLMMAQRGAAWVEGIEINALATWQARENVLNCQWNNRISIVHSSVQSFAESASGKYQLIVSNPPFFHESYHPADAHRAQARHSHLLSMEDLMRCASALLTPDGHFCLVLPAEQLQQTTDIALYNHLHLHRTLLIHPRPEKDPNRVLMDFGANKKTPECRHLSIRQSRCNTYHDTYLSLTRNFYLFA